MCLTKPNSLVLPPCLSGCHYTQIQNLRLECLSSQQPHLQLFPWVAMNCSGAGHWLLSPGPASASAAQPRQGDSCARCLSLCLFQHGVEETAAECQKLGATVQTFVVDCSKREEIYSAADKVGQQGHGQRLSQTFLISRKVRKTSLEVLYTNPASPWKLPTPRCSLYTECCSISKITASLILFGRLQRITPWCQVCSLGFQPLREHWGQMKHFIVMAVVQLP